jgi:hypothetical protein
MLSRGAYWLELRMVSIWLIGNLPILPWVFLLIQEEIEHQAVEHKYHEDKEC